MATSKTSTKATSTTSTIAKQWYEEEVYMDEWIDGWMDWWMNGLMDAGMDGYRDGWMHMNGCEWMEVARVKMDGKQTRFWKIIIFFFFYLKQNLF